MRESTLPRVRHIVENKCQLIDYIQLSRDSVFIGRDKVVAMGLEKPVFRFCFSCSTQQHTQSQRDRHYRSFQSLHVLALAGLCILKSYCLGFFSPKEPNRIKSRKQHVSQSVSTAFPLHVASGDLFFFLLTSKLGNIQLGNTLETKNEIKSQASKLFMFPALILHIILLVCLFQ